LLLLHRSDGRTAPLQPEIASTKGKSIGPEDGRAGCFRHHSPRCHRYFSLVHTPDAPADLLFEAKVLLDDSKFLERDWTCTPDVPFSIVKHLIYPENDWVSEESYEAILQMMRLGLAFLIGDPRSQTDTHRAAGIYEKMAVGGIDSLPSRQDLKDLFRPTGNSPSDPGIEPGALFAALRYAMLRTALERISTLGELTPISGTTILSAFESSGCMPTRWLRHRFQLYLTFPNSN